MVQSSSLDASLSAIADPVRRAILDQLASGPASISQLAEPFGMSLTGLKKHVRVLEDARLVTTAKRGRVRECRLGPQQLEAAAGWIEQYRQRWERRLDGLEAAIEGKRQRVP